jgi:bifunctional pyridoxal-dependent enzyme with beta-cystathionase and maltose regulon repressor activities
VFADLASLRRRRSSKWVSYPPDVLPAFVAETDEAVRRMAAAVSAARA